MKIKIEEGASDQDKLAAIFDLPAANNVEVSKEEDDEEVEPQDVTCCWLCSRDGVETSEFYCNARYCGEECRERHHPADHDEPWPVLTKYKPGVGRLLVAARDIDPGELIFTEECFAMGPNHTLTGNNCLECLKEITDGRTCPLCGWPVCCEECQVGPNHSVECAVLAANRDKINMEKMRESDALYWPISALRILIKCQQNPVSHSIIKRMMSHMEEQRKRVTWPQYKEHLVRMIREDCGLGDTFSEEEVEHVSGLIDVNSIRLLANGRYHVECRNVDRYLFIYAFSTLRFLVFNLCFQII